MARRQEELKNAGAVVVKKGETEVNLMSWLSDRALQIPLCVQAVLLSYTASTPY